MEAVDLSGIVMKKFIHINVYFSCEFSINIKKTVVYQTIFSAEGYEAITPYVWRKMGKRSNGKILCLETSHLRLVACEKCRRKE